MPRNDDDDDDGTKKRGRKKSRVKPKPDIKPEHIFVFPPQSDEIKITNIGTIIIDFYTGKVRATGGAKGEAGRLPRLQKNLRGVGRKNVRSLLLRVDKKVRIYTDEDNKQLIPVEAGDLWRLEMLPFKVLYINILSTNTTIITCIASTSLVGFAPTLSRTPTTFKGGQKTVSLAGTAEALGSDTPIRGVTIVALKDNTGFVYLSDSTVDSSGDKLWAGDTRNIAIDNLNKIYLDVSVSGDGVTYSYVV